MNYSGKLDDQYHIARIVDPGKSSESYRGHFDSHCFTLVIPLHIPEYSGSGYIGELVFFPKARNFPKNEFVNLIQKLLFKLFSNKKGFSRLSKKTDMIENDFSDFRPLLFIGHQTFHGNKELLK